MSRAQQPLNNAEYRDALSAGSAVYPDWWGINGGRLVPLESGVGTRIRLNAFYPLLLDTTNRCDYWKQNRDFDFDPTAFSWSLWVYGAYHEVTPQHCTQAQDFGEFLFYAVRGSSQPIPAIEFGNFIGNAPADEVTKEYASLYVTRELTQKMDIGLFYLGVVVVDGATSDGLALPPGATPADVVRSRPRLPPLWLFLQDSSREAHGNFENIPKGRGALCP